MQFFCKVLTLFCAFALCAAVRRPQPTRNVERGGPKPPTIGEEVDTRQSPTFSILSHMAQPLAVRPRRKISQPERLPLQEEIYYPPQEVHQSRSDTSNPSRPIRKPDTWVRSKPTFNLASDALMGERHNRRSSQPSYDKEIGNIPPVYVQNKPTIKSSGNRPTRANEPEYEEGANPARGYRVERQPTNEIKSSKYLTPDPEKLTRSNPISGAEQDYEAYGNRPSNPQSGREFINYPQPGLTPDSPQRVPSERIPQTYRQPEETYPSLTQVEFAKQPVRNYDPETNAGLIREPVITKVHRPEPAQFSDHNPSSYKPAHLPFRQPPKKIISDSKLKVQPNYNDQDVPKKTIRKQVVKPYIETVVPNREQPHQLKSGDKVYDQQGSHSGAGGHLDQNGVEFVSDASKTMKEPGTGRITFQIHGQEGPHSYRFGYDTGKGPHRQFRYEEKDGYGEVKGRYGFYDEGGKLQLVNYSSHPEHGFQTDIGSSPKH